MLVRVLVRVRMLVLVLLLVRMRVHALMTSIHLHDRIRESAPCDAVCGHCGHPLQNLPLPIQERHLQRKPHPERMDRPTRQQTHAQRRPQAFAPPQPTHSGHWRLKEDHAWPAAPGRHGSASRKDMNIGNPMTMNVQGKIKSIRGSSSLTGAFSALRSA